MMENEPAMTFRETLIETDPDRMAAFDVRREAAAKALRDEARAARKVRAKRALDPSGGKVVVGTRVVADPIEIGARLKVRVNLAEHPLEMMLAKRRLDPALYEAGARYRAIFERAAIGPGRGIDPERIRVDGGRMGDPLNDMVADAHRDLARLARVLGPCGEAVVRAVCGEGVPVGTLAKRWPGGEAERAKMDYLSMRLREALDQLATEVWGAKGPQRGKMRALLAERDGGLR